jgi:hypothetical protein
MATNYKRRRLWVDTPFQGRLLFRIGFYMLMYALLVWHIGFTFEVLMSIARNGFSKGMSTIYMEYLRSQTPLLYAFAVIAPILLYDMLKFSNRVAGPLFRCRRVMEEMAEGKQVPEFIPRKHDLLREFFQAFNALITSWNTRLNAGANGSAPGADTTAISPPDDALPPKSPSAEAQRVQIQPADTFTAR